MKSEHGYIFEQMRNDAIAEALRFFGLSDIGGGETVLVFGHVTSPGTSTVRCEIFRNGRSMECEFPRSFIEMQRASSVTALIEIPKTFVSIFRLASLVLDDREIERYRRSIEVFNAPYLPPTVRRLETVGGVRI